MTIALIALGGVLGGLLGGYLLGRRRYWAGFRDALTVNSLTYLLALQGEPSEVRSRVASRLPIATTEACSQCGLDSLESDIQRVTLEADRALLEDIPDY